MSAASIEKRLLGLRNEDEARHLAHFFKTGEGQYGHGDKFLGIKVPVTRSIVKEFRAACDITDCKTLIQSEWHEIRLAGFLLLIELYSKAKKAGDLRRAAEIVTLYLNNLDRGNNWDLVDLVAPKILGDWLVTHPDEREELDRLASMDGFLWHQRVAIVATFALIRAGEYDDTLRIADLLLDHKHDLIHKAVGWMLREMGKRGGYNLLIGYLDRNTTQMPRTALRYAIERLPETLRRYYMQKPPTKCE